MSELIVLAFKSESGAQEMLGTIGQLQKQQLIKLEDAATVVRKGDKPKIKQAQSLVGAGALGLAVGAIAGALGGKLSDIGIDDDFIKEVGETVEPGHSALFLLVQSWTEDKVLAELSKYEAEVLRTSLSEEDDAKLRETFSAAAE